MAHESLFFFQKLNFHPIDIILFRHLRACDVPVIGKPLLTYHSLDPLAIDL